MRRVQESCNGLSPQGIQPTTAEPKDMKQHGIPEKASRPNTSLKELVRLYGVLSQGNIRVFQKPGVQPVIPKGVAVGVGVLVTLGVGVAVLVAVGDFVGVGVCVGHRGVGVGVRLSWSA